MDNFNNTAVNPNREGIKISQSDFFRLPDEMRRVTDEGLMVLVSASSEQVFKRAIIVH